MEIGSIIQTLPDRKFKPFKTQPDLEIDDALIKHPDHGNLVHRTAVPVYAMLSDVLSTETIHVRCQLTGEVIPRTDRNTSQLDGGGFYRTTDRYGETPVEIFDYENFNAADWCLVPPEPATPPVHEPFDTDSGVSLATVLGNAISAAGLRFDGV